MKAKKTAGIAAITGLLMVLLSGCTTVLEGTVVGKQHKESYEESYQTCLIYSTETPGLCQQYTTNYRTVPEKWTVMIEGENSEGELDQKVYTIPESNWDETYEGDFMRFDENGRLVEHSGKLR